MGDRLKKHLKIKKLLNAVDNQKTNEIDAGTTADIKYLWLQNRNSRIKQTIKTRKNCSFKLKSQKSLDKKAKKYCNKRKNKV